MLAERALQSACGPEHSIKVLAEQDDINLEYCDREDATKDCSLLFDGRPVRHVRLDDKHSFSTYVLLVLFKHKLTLFLARVAVVSDIKRREIFSKKSLPMKKVEGPWFL